MRIIQCPVCKGEGYHETLGVCQKCHGTGHTVTLDIDDDLPEDEEES